MMAEAAAPCRLYLVLPPASPTIERSLAQALAATEVACVLRWGGKDNIDEAWDAQLRALVHQYDAAYLIEGDSDRAKRVGADGVHIAANVPLYRRTRDYLGQRAIIGVGCGLSRHDAMVLGELGADYVAFGPDAAEGGREGARECAERAELIAWWAETVEVPGVAWNVETRADAERLAHLGADFVGLAPSIWQAAEPARLIAEIGAALGSVRTAA
jgi:thiamine-phosphate pyrophosphorylase